MIAKDDYVIVLDFLHHGKPADRRAEPVAQCVGDKFFNLLEVAIKDGIDIKTKDRLYIGEAKRDQVKYIRGRINYSELTSYAKDTIQEVVAELIEKGEKRFVEFFNKSSPLTTRMHSLELLPGIGKKHLWQILKERKIKSFESFKEISERVQMMPDPRKMVVKRIFDEFEEKDKHRLFVASAFI